MTASGVFFLQWDQTDAELRSYESGLGARRLRGVSLGCARSDRAHLSFRRRAIYVSSISVQPEPKAASRPHASTRSA